MLSGGSYIPASVAKLFVYSPRLGPTEETEHEKILFYYPASASLSQQLKDVGLSEAFVNFSRTFSPQRPCSTVHTEKTRQVFLQAENDVWMVLCVRNPRTTARENDKYHEDELHDGPLHAVLKNAYSIFCLFNGTMESVLLQDSVAGLRRKLSQLLPSFIASLPPISKLDLAFSLSGIRYFPVDRNTFLSLKSFHNLTQHDFKSLRYSLCVQQDLLVWSSLPDANDTHALYSYLVMHVAETGVYSSVLAETSTRSTRGLPPAKDPFDGPPVFGPYNRSWVLPLSITPSQVALVYNKIPKVVISQDTATCHLVLFRHEQLLWAFLVDQSEDLSGPLLSALASFITSQVIAVEKTLSSLDTRPQLPFDEPYRYLYFNHMNLALKETLNQRWGGSAGGSTIKGGGIILSPEILALVMEIHVSLSERAAKTPGESSNPAFSKCSDYMSPCEICVKTFSEGWIVGRSSNGRELYVVTDNKSGSLVEVHAEVERITSHYFSNIFI